MLYTKQQAVDYLQIDKQTLEYATKKGMVAAIRPTPRRVFYLKDDLDAWRDSWRREKASKEI